MGVTNDIARVAIGASLILELIEPESVTTPCGSITRGSKHHLQTTS